ncbi:hypothetical protein Sango_0351200 [Sesamum angolense]|uniref:Uncharacterized protein n=1 Tax=Sesamum angolense TaxID=2727404 RepID=A0AAE2C3H6_9LAMI|nr:hypothetical protein Sango_0351200 [Sesamum angolense]
MLSADFTVSQIQRPNLHRIYGEPSAENKTAQWRNWKRGVADEAQASLGNGVVHLWLPNKRCRSSVKVGGIRSKILVLYEVLAHFMFTIRDNCTHLFEWAWQHPVRSLAVRAAAASFKSVSGLANKIKLAYTMLTLPAWQSLNLTMNFFSTKYQIYISGCPTLPEKKRTQVRSMDELPCYNRNACLNDEFEADEECEVSGSFEASTSEESTEAMRTAHDSPSNHYNFEENMHMQMNQKDNSSCECSEEREHDQRQTFFVLHNDYSVRASSSFITDSCDIAGYAEAGQKCSDVSPDKLSIATLLSDKESFSTEASWHTVSYIEDGQKSSDVAPQKPSTATSFSVKQPFSVEGPSILCKVEVIDILTPSPCYRVNTGSKKRRPAAYPEIIDLTNSPMFV